MTNPFNGIAIAIPSFVGRATIIFIFNILAQLAVADTTVDLRTEYRKSICGFSVDQSFSQKQQQIFDEDLIFLLSIQGKKSSILHKMFFGSEVISGVAYCNFLGRKIKSINYHSQLEKGRVGSNYFHSGDINLGDFFFELTQIARLGTLIHEARHTDDWDTEHVTCGQDIFSLTGVNLRDKLACDNKIDGAYGYEFIWYEAIFNDCQSCSSSTRQEAFLSAKRSQRRILSLPQ